MTARDGLSCDSARARLAAAADPRRVPADLAGHVAGCLGCTAYAATLVRVDALIPRLPVPTPSLGAKAAALELTVSGPIIVRRAPAPATPSGLVRVGRAVWAARETWQYAAGVAATLAVGVGLYLAGTRSPRVEYAGPRHELLASQVRSLARLSAAETAEARVVVWAGVVGELAAETERVHAGASAEDFAALDRMFTAAVTKGLVGQAKNLPPNLTVAEKRARLKPGADALAAVRAAAEVQSKAAPVQAVATWKRLATTAADGHATLERLTQPEA